MHLGRSSRMRSEWLSRYLACKNDIVCVRRSRVLPRNASIDRIGVANLLELQDADNRSEQ
jgi:hypothetical protein